ncbi:hypothetical protein [Paenilisteria rocourtiae]|uniref:Uncharacterized protein n=1 Tax=Listeria rocourtiae TaxID=647910 RepID=A0A4V6PYP5_9LIST|nr:hypothetical protein [Listeria rocourtiae]EUJ44430.1 hypothetical protein PROCOU_14043 [Listeria rocourtiae FSL F6-920]TDR55086.1 hypothetical protein DFP96_10112 [Listeria rocourtiae]
MRNFAVGEKVMLILNQETVVAEIVSVNAGTYTVVHKHGVNYRVNKHEVMSFDTSEVGSDTIMAKVEFIKAEERILDNLNDDLEKIRKETGNMRITKRGRYSDEYNETLVYIYKNSKEAIILGYELALDAQTEKVLELKSELERGDYSVDKTD